MSCANDHFFLDPAERTKYERFAKQGISFPEEDKLERDTVIYRIGHSNKSYNTNISSPWWMRDSTFDYLRIKAERDNPEMRGDRAFRKLFRNKLAVSYNFGVSDTIVKAVLKQRLRVFTGRGKYIEDTETAATPMGWIGAFEIAQVFIPGLRLDDGTISPSCKGSLYIISYRPLNSYFS